MQDQTSARTGWPALKVVDWTPTRDMPSLTYEEVIGVWP
jgi:hypothetical protein